MPSENTRSVWIAFFLLLVSCALFLTLNAHGNWDFVLPLRGAKLGALLLVAYAVGVSTLLFQTLTNNPILTPSLLGFESLYIFLQTLLVAVLGGVGYTHLPPLGKFGFEAAAMIGGSLLLFRILLKQGGRDLARMILTGVIFGILFRSLSSLLQRLILTPKNSPWRKPTRLHRSIRSTKIFCLSARLWCWPLRFLSGENATVSTFICWGATKPSTSASTTPAILCGYWCGLRY